MNVLSIFKEGGTVKCRDPFKILSFIITISFANFYYGYCLTYLSSIDFDVIMQIYSITLNRSMAQGFLQGIILIGGAVGAISANILVQKVSRKHFILMVNAFAVVLGVLAYYQNFTVFFCVRFLQGVAAGLFSTIVPLVNKEFSPAETTNFMGIFCNLLIVVGIFFAYFFKLILSFITFDSTGASYWKTIYALPILVILIQTFVYVTYYPFETPKYLALNGKTQELKTLLKYIYKDEYVDEMYAETMKCVQSQGGNPEDAKKSRQTPKIAFLYANYLSIMAPLIGPNICIAYGGDIISKIIPPLTQFIPTLLMFELLVASTISVYFLNIYGRKAHVMAGTLSCLICLIVITVGYFISGSSSGVAQMMILFGLICYIFCFGMTFSPVVWIFIPEVLQPNLIGYAVMGNWSGAAVVTILFPIVIDILPGHNPGYVFLFFVFIAFVSLFVSKKFMIETKDKSELQIYEEYKQMDKQIFGEKETPQTQLGLLNQHKKDAQK